MLTFISLISGSGGPTVVLAVLFFTFYLYLCPNKDVSDKNTMMPSLSVARFLQISAIVSLEHRRMKAYYVPVLQLETVVTQK